MKILFTLLLLTSIIPSIITSESKSATSPNKALGIDISHYDGDMVELLNTKSDSLSFLVCKATGGITIRDHMYKENWKVIKDKKFLRGAYHFYYTADDPIKQAEHYLSVTDSLHDSNFPPIVDFESGSLNANKSVDHTLKGLHLFLAKLEAVTQRIPIIYTGIDVGQKYFTDTSFSRYPLWICYYNKEAMLPEIPLCWKQRKWLMWQKMDQYDIGSGTSDFDVFNGTPLELNLFLQHR